MSEQKKLQPAEFCSKKIGKNAIKIACFQTLPGKEHDSRKEIESALKALSDSKDFVKQIVCYAVFKALGAFDIIVVYAVNDLGPQLSERLFPYILKHNLLFCYHFMDDNELKYFFDKLKKSPLAAVCLLKFPDIDQAKPKDIFKSLLEESNAKLENKKAKSQWTVLGSLGWNEAVVFMQTENIEDLAHDARLLGAFPILESTTCIPALKTLSFLCVPYTYIPEEIPANTNWHTLYNCILSKSGDNFSKNKNLLYGLLKPDNLTLPNNKLENAGKIDGISAVLEIVARPHATHDIIKYFDELKEGKEGVPALYYGIRNVIGSKDIVVFPIGNISLGEFLAVILAFRVAKANDIIATYTRVHFGKDSIGDDINPLTQCKPFRAGSRLDIREDKLKITGVPDAFLFNLKDAIIYIYCSTSNLIYAIFASNNK